MSGRDNVIRFDRTSDWYYKTGLKHARKQNTSTALRYMVRASELDPGNREYYLQIARLLNRNGEYAQSSKILLFLSAMLDAERPGGRDMMAESYWLLSQNCQETEEYEKSMYYAGKSLRVQPEGKFADECRSLVDYYRSCGYIEWDARWDAIIETCMLKSVGVFSEIYREELEILMINIGYNALDARSPEEGDFERVEVWAAVLEYIYAKISRIRRTRRAIAEKYGISVYSLTKRLNLVFDIDMR